MGMLTRRRRESAATTDTDGRTVRPSYDEDTVDRSYAPDNTVRPAYEQDTDAGRPVPTSRAATRPSWHDPTRAVVTLAAGAIAGFLAWLSTQVGSDSTGGYWAEYGILAGAGLVIALSQIVGGWTKWGRPRFAPLVFLVACVPALIAIGWIVGFHQPQGNWFRSHLVSWSGDLGIAGFVQTMGGELLTLLAFAAGLVFGLCFDTSGRAPARPVEAAVSREQAVADEPLTREREVVRS